MIGKKREKEELLFTRKDLLIQILTVVDFFSKRVGLNNLTNAQLLRFSNNYSLFFLLEICYFYYN